MMYSIISIIILACSIYLFKGVSGSLKFNKLNMISMILYFDLLTQAWIASVLIINGLDDHYIIKKLSSADAKYLGWLGVQYTLIALPLGMYITLYAFGYKNNNKLFDRYVSSRLLPAISKNDRYIKALLMMLSVVCIGSVAYVLSSVGGWVGFEILKGGGTEFLKAYRHSASHGYEGNVYIKNIIAIGFTPVLTYIAYCYYKLTKSKVDLLWFFVLFVTVFFILTYSVEKAPFIKFLSGFIFLTVLLNGRVSNKLLIFTVISMLGILVIFYAVSMDGSELPTIISYNSGILGRIILSQAGGTYLSFDLFPVSVDHLGGASISQYISHAFDLDHSARSAAILSENYNAIKYNNNNTGVINSLFISEAWANFGFWGVILAPIYVGILIQTLFMFFLTLPKTPVFVGLFCSFSYQSAINGGFNGYLYSVRPILTILCFIGIYILANLFKVDNRNVR